MPSLAEWFSVIGLAVGLAMDAFAVSVSSGLVLERVTHRHVFRLAFHFGLFQFVMPIIGWLVGRQLATMVQAYDHWVACGLLVAVGGKMLWEARSDHAEQASTDPTRGLSLVTLSVATSLDALAVGLSMALTGVSIWLPAIVIGTVTAALCVAGICFGSRIGSRWGRYADAFGGCLLIVIGLKILLSHLLNADVG